MRVSVEENGQWLLLVFSVGFGTTLWWRDWSELLVLVY